MIKHVMLQFEPMIEVTLLCVLLYVVSILVLQSSLWGRGGGAGCFAWFVFLVSRGCCVALLCGAMGLSAVYDCGIP